jgi:radical SAM protein with 4Fe4S-binding SPASM domain
MPIRVGNLQETPLAELYYQNDLLSALRDRSRTSEGCQGCCFTGLCRGGLKCLAYATTGNPFQADPSCWLAERADGPEGRCDSEKLRLVARAFAYRVESTGEDQAIGGTKGLDRWKVTTTGEMNTREDDDAVASASRLDKRRGKAYEPSRVWYFCLAPGGGPR